MTASFRDAMQAALPAGLTYPPELIALFDWIETQGLVRPFRKDIGRGPFYATLFPEDAIAYTEDPDTGTEHATGGTHISFFPSIAVLLGAWGADCQLRQDHGIMLAESQSRIGAG